MKNMYFTNYVVRSLQGEAEMKEVAYSQENIDKKL